MASSLSPTRDFGGRFLLLHDKDNVLICAANAAKGSVVAIDGQDHVLSSDIEIGHKIARTHLEPGAKVIRYGVTIGTISRAAKPGDHVHNHNLQSDYIPAHDRNAAREQEIRS